MRPCAPLYLAYLSVVGSGVGAVLHGNPDTYRYIAGVHPRTTQGPPGVVDRLQDGGVPAGRAGGRFSAG